MGNGERWVLTATPRRNLAKVVAMRQPRDAKNMKIMPVKYRK